MSSPEKLRAFALRFLGAALVSVVAGLAGGTGSGAAPTRTIAVLVPFVADAGDGLFLDAQELAAETGPSGDWSILLDVAKRHGLTVALDTRISASIEALGADAPVSSTEWLAEVNALDPILLPWGNADLWTLRPWATNPFTAQNFGSLAGVDPASLVLWPSGGVINNDSVPISVMRGFTRMIVGDDHFAGGFNSVASAALATAVAPGSVTSVEESARTVRLALGTRSTIVLPAEPGEVDASLAAAVLDRIIGSELETTHVVPLSMNTARVPRITVVGPDLLGEVLDAVARDEDRASTLTADPVSLIANRIRTLSVVTRNLNPDAFEPSARAFISDTNWLTDLVSIALATEYTVLSNTADIPVSISNSSGAAVTITVAVRSTSGIVQVNDRGQSVTIEPRSNVRITVPMTAVANGRTTLVATLLDSSGETIGAPVSFPIEVQAQWEILTVVVFFGSVIVIMTIGILRTIRRRRALA
jgi:hypothetical protein